MRLHRSRRSILAVVLALAVVTAAAACRPVDALPPAAARAGAPASLPPPRPAACVDVPAGAPLQPILDGAPAGAALCLAPGEHRGPIRIDRGRTVWGPRAAVIRSSGEGTTVRLEGAGARLLGVTVDGSGGRFDLLDAAVHMSGDDHAVEGVRVVRAVFGILVEKARRARVRACEVQGDAAQPHGLRGDTIRLWEARDSVVEDNVVRDGRDVVVWYSPDNRLARNTMEGGRYGAHLMYSSGVVVEGNRAARNVVGLFVMYSRDVVVRDNVLAGSAGAAGIGLGVKESGNLAVERNLFVRDTCGLYIDGSPLREGDADVFEDNAFHLDDVAVTFHASQRGNRFARNRFHDNRQQVVVEGGGDALGSAWEGNDWDDYAGYDLDGDGTGDLPYELRSLSGQLASTRPALRFFDGTPALAMLDAAARVLPLFRPKTLLVDARPRVGPPPPTTAAPGPEDPHAR